MQQPQASFYGFDIWGLGTILYARTETGLFIYGHDGQNDPAINSAVRINPDSGDAIIVFSSGNQSLATTLGSEWVFWQTGQPGFLSFGSLVTSGIQIMAYGSILIVMIITLLAWWNRRRPSE
jgi:hypothetical protein